MAMRAVGLLSVVGALIITAGCSDTDDEAPAARSSSSSAPAAQGALPQAGAPTAQQVVDAFASAGLPVPNPRDNSKNCATLGCVALVTTDAISVYTWPDEQSAQHMVDVALGGGAYRRGLVVLSYTAARTPEADRPRYEAELGKLS